MNELSAFHLAYCNGADRSRPYGQCIVHTPSFISSSMMIVWLSLQQDNLKPDQVCRSLCRNMSLQVAG